MDMPAGAGAGAGGGGDDAQPLPAAKRRRREEPEKQKLVIDGKEIKCSHNYNGVVACRYNQLYIGDACGPCTCTSAACKNAAAKWRHDGLCGKYFHPFHLPAGCEGGQPWVCPHCRIANGDTVVAAAVAEAAAAAKAAAEATRAAADVKRAAKAAHAGTAGGGAAAGTGPQASASTGAPALSGADAAVGAGVDAGAPSMDNGHAAENTPKAPAAAASAPLLALQPEAATPALSAAAASAVAAPAPAAAVSPPTGDPAAGAPPLGAAEGAAAAVDGDVPAPATAASPATGDQPVDAPPLGAAEGAAAAADGGSPAAAQSARAAHAGDAAAAAGGSKPLPACPPVLQTHNKEVNKYQVQQLLDILEDSMRNNPPGLPESTLFTDLNDRLDDLFCRPRGTKKNRAQGSWTTDKVFNAVTKELCRIKYLQKEGENFTLTAAYDDFQQSIDRNRPRVAREAAPAPVGLPARPGGRRTRAGGEAAAPAPLQAPLDPVAYAAQAEREAVVANERKALAELELKLAKAQKVLQGKQTTLEATQAWKDREEAAKKLAAATPQAAARGAADSLMARFMVSSRENTSALQELTMLDRAHSVRDCAVKPARTFRIMHWNLDAVYGFSGGVEVLKTKLKNLRLVLHFYDVTAAVVTEIPDIDLDALLSENMMTKGSMVGYTWRKSPSTGARECVLFLVRDDGDEVQFETDAVCATWPGFVHPAGTAEVRPSRRPAYCDIILNGMEDRQKNRKQHHIRLYGVHFTPETHGPEYARAEVERLGVMMRTDHRRDTSILTGDFNLAPPGLQPEPDTAFDTLMQSYDIANRSATNLPTISKAAVDAAAAGPAAAAEAAAQNEAASREKVYDNILLPKGLRGLIVRHFGPQQAFVVPIDEAVVKVAGVPLAWLVRGLTELEDDKVSAATLEEAAGGGRRTRTAAKGMSAQMALSDHRPLYVDLHEV